jgi:hypothetical protein
MTSAELNVAVITDASASRTPPLHDNSNGHREIPVCPNEFESATNLFLFANSGFSLARFGKRRWPAWADVSEWYIITKLCLLGPLGLLAGKLSPQKVTLETVTTTRREWRQA